MHGVDEGGGGRRVAAAVGIGGRGERCCMLARCTRAAAVVVCFEEKHSAVAGLVHAFDSWQRCV